MDIYLGFVYACLISFANASQFTTQTPKFQNCGFNMAATCDDVMWLFVDGEQLVGNSSDWRVRSEVHIPANTKVIEIHCLDSWIHGGILASSDNGLITDGAWKCSSDNRKTWKSAFLLGKNGRTAPDISPEAIWIWTDMSHWMQTDHRNHTKAICKIELATSQCPETCPPFNEPVRKTTPIPTTTATIRTTTPSKPKPGFNLTATCDNDMKLFVDGNLEATSNNWRDTSQVIIPANTESIEIHCATSGIVGGILASSNNGLLTDGAWNCSSDNGATWNPAYEVGPNGGAVSDISPEAEWIWTTGCIGDWTYKYTGKRHKKNVICKIDLKPVIDGGWSALSPFSSCSATCGEATKWQTRTCSNPLPTNGGEPCHGSDEVVVSCGLAPCGGHSCPYTDKYKDCPKWKSHCKSGEWTACMNEDCPKTCKCSSCGVTLCSSTEGCPSVKNKLLTTLPQLKKQFLVSFEFLATEFINGWQNVIHFTENGSCCDDGTRVPAVWVSNSGQLYPQFAVNGNGVYGIKTTKKYSLNEWHKVEFSQKLENNKYIYKVIIDGVKQIEVENKQPKIFSNVKVYAADPWFNSLKGSLKNLFINTEGTNKCEGLTLHATCDNNMKIFADTKLLITDNDWKKTSEVKIPENTNTIEIHCYDLHVVGGILASFDNGLKTDGTWSCSANGGSTWNPAYEIGANGMSPWGVRPQISTKAKWIWTGKDAYHGKHKNVICKISLGISTTTATMATTKTTARTAATETTAITTTTDKICNTVNEGKELSVKCPSSQKINIGSALYGKEDIGCSVSTSLSKVKALCQGKNSCDVPANNGVFGDPCGGVRKFLTICSSCVDKTCNTVNEGKELSVKCPSSQKINVDSALYGKEDIGCSASTSLSKVKALCQGKNSCNVPANNGIFGDPCGEVRKFLTICSSCVGISTTTATITIPETTTTTTTTEITDGTCYLDDSSRLLDDYHSSSTNTPDECKKTCSSRGYFYAGVQAGSQCFCGNDKPPTSRIKDSSECNSKCPGDASKKCGGSWRMNIYKSVTCPKDWTTLTSGCYQIMDGGNYQQATTNCKNSGGFLAEVNNQKEQDALLKFYKDNGHAANVWLGATDLAKDGEWIWEHSGSKMTFTAWNAGEPNGKTNENCLHAHSNLAKWNDLGCHGSLKALCEYDGIIPTEPPTTTTSAPTTPAPGVEITDGTCYLDDSSRLLDDYHGSSTNTPDECKKTCSSRGYFYAGVQAGSQCFCGNDKPPTSRIKDSSECNSKCPGDASKKCGGSWRMNIYKSVTCPKDWITLTSGCYQIMDGGNYQQATTNCKNSGGFLAEVNNQKEQDALLKFYKDNGHAANIWLGATDLAKDGEWIWEHSGSKMTFTAWNAGEPNGKTNENCLHAHSNLAKWNDLGCHGSLKALCEYDGIIPTEPPTTTTSAPTTPAPGVEANTCTTDIGACIFPFTYKGKTYNECTKVNHNQAWCATKEDQTGNWWGNCPSTCKMHISGQRRRPAFGLRSWAKQKNEKTSNVSSLPGQTGLKLQFQLKGKTGTEKVKVLVDDNEEEYDLTPQWRLFSYPRPPRGAFSVEFLNDIGYTDVFIRGHESQVTDLLPNFPANKFLGCATENENEKCELLRKGTLMWNGKYTYTLKGQ